MNEGSSSFTDRRNIGLLELLNINLKAGTFGFSMGMISVIEQEVVTRRALLTHQDLSDGLALANLIPGPISFDVAVYVGYRLRGWPGATIAMVGLVLPAFILMLGLTIAYLNYSEVPQVHAIFKGLNAAVVALILSVAYRIGESSVRSVSQIALGVAALVASLLHANLIALLIGCGLVGAFFLAPPAQVVE